MVISKPEKHALECSIFQYRSEAGLQSLRAWLFMRQAEITAEWPELIGEDLVRLQGEAKSIAKQIKMLDVGPKFPKETEQ